MKKVMVFAVILAWSVSANATNLVVNGDFSGALSSWSSYDAVLTNEAGLAGQTAPAAAVIAEKWGKTDVLCVQKTNIMYGNGVWQAWYLHSGLETGATQYKIAFDYAYEDIESHGLYGSVGFTWRNPDGSGIWPIYPYFQFVWNLSEEEDDIFNSSDGWIHKEFILNVGTAQAGNNITIVPDVAALFNVELKFINPNSGNYENNQNGRIYFDNVVLESVPEPITIALLGIGSLFVTRRK